MRARGLTLREKDGIRHLRRVTAASRSEEIGVVDLVIVSLQPTTNGALAELLPTLLGPRTAVVTLQNELGSEEFVAGMVGESRVMGGLCYIGVTREAPGEITGYYSKRATCRGWLTAGSAELIPTGGLDKAM